MTILTRAVASFSLLFLFACGAADGSDDSSGGDSQGSGGTTGTPGSTGGAGSVAGGAGSVDAPECFAPFEVDGDLSLTELDEVEVASVCSIQKATWHCVYPDFQLCTYLGAALSQDEPVERCVELETMCLEEGGPLIPNEFECALAMGSDCSGTVAQLELCMRDTLLAFGDQPPIEWSCENREAVVERIHQTGEFTPDSCIQFDGCLL